MSMTPKQEAALRLALEALDSYHGYMEPLTTVFGGPRVPAEQSTTGKVEKAITALRRALEQQPNRALVTCLFDAAAKSGNPKSIELAAQLSGVPPCEKCGYVIQHCRCPQPAEEPVAFQIFKPTPPRLAIPNVRDAELPWVYDQDPSSGNVASMWVTPVARPQPAAQWVGLTDEEIALVCAECAASAHRHDDISYARAIEAKLKERNT